MKTAVSVSLDLISEPLPRDFRSPVTMEPYSYRLSEKSHTFHMTVYFSREQCYVLKLNM